MMREGKVGGTSVVAKECPQPQSRSNERLQSSIEQFVGPYIDERSDNRSLERAQEDSFHGDSFRDPRMHLQGSQVKPQ